MSNYQFNITNIRTAGFGLAINRELNALQSSSGFQRILNEIGTISSSGQNSKLLNFNGGNFGTVSDNKYIIKFYDNPDDFIGAARSNGIQIVPNSSLFGGFGVSRPTPSTIGQTFTANGEIYVYLSPDPNIVASNGSRFFLGEIIGHELAHHSREVIYNNDQEAWEIRATELGNAIRIENGRNGATFLDRFPSNGAGWDTITGSRGKIDTIASPPKCFPAGTPILMADDFHKPIERIAVGDWIMALDPAQPFAGLVPRQVVRLYRNTTDTWLKLTFLDGGTLSATPGHEMLAVDGRFARLDQLVSWQADGTGRVTLVGESGELRPARAETIRFSAATAHLYPLADAAALAQGHQIAPHTFGNLALPPVHRDTQRYVIAPQ
jgi:hypothetical protein